MDDFFARFNVCNGTTHSDLLTTNLLRLAARAGVEVEVFKVNESDVRVVKGCRSVVGSDWENLRTLVTA
jgi:multimeric flavodoxin WrbA